MLYQSTDYRAEPVAVRCYLLINGVPNVTNVASWSLVAGLGRLTGQGITVLVALDMSVLPIQVDLCMRLRVTNEFLSSTRSPRGESRPTVGQYGQHLGPVGELIRLGWLRYSPRQYVDIQI